jgi:2-polyprenyl-3-methyl-5-hydroxy-6-metoxy-1,4-benzoquinol methylase
MDRSIEPELLDTLPPNHPDAMHNRRDLRLTNAFMRNHTWFVRTLPGLVRSGERVLEVGAGTGELGRKLAARGVTVDGLDLWPRPEDWPETANWHQADIRTFTGWSEYAVVIGNLIFHQFTDSELREIGRHLRQARLVLACEPLRRRLSQVMYRAVAPLLGANYVSLHDAHVSIAAGFLDRELPHTFGFASPEWDVRCTPTHLGAYHMIACRLA